MRGRENVEIRDKWRKGIVGKKKSSSKGKEWEKKERRI